MPYPDDSRLPKKNASIQVLAIAVRVSDHLRCGSLQPWIIVNSACYCMTKFSNGEFLRSLVVILFDHYRDISLRFFHFSRSCFAEHFTTLPSHVKDLLKNKQMFQGKDKMIDIFGNF